MTQDSFRSNLLAKSTNHSFLVLTFLFSVCGLLIWRLFSFISRYAVNILYHDQWGFYTPLFYYKNLWQMFSWQHGPHRQGIGLLVTAIVAQMTQWNSRADAFAAGVLLCLAMLCALILKRRLFGSFSFFDVTIPFVFLTLFQYEALVVTPNLSHGVFPLFLIMLYCLTLLMKNPVVRYGILLVLNFLLVYTGFGMFMGLVTMGLLSIDIYQNRKNRKELGLPVIAFFLALASNLSFLISYHFDPAIPNFSFSVAYLLQYPIFIGLMLAAFWGWHAMILGQPIAIMAGAFLFLIILFVFLFHGRRVLKQGIYFDRLNLIVTVLIGYSLLFCLNTAIGRIPLGLQQAQVSRYLTLMIPAYLALYLHLQTMSVGKSQRLFLSVFLAISVVGMLPLGVVESLALKVRTDKENWKACYLQYEDVAKCDQLAKFQIFPENNEDLRNKLAYLKERRLNLFIPRKPGE